MPEDLDETRDRRDASQQAKSGPLGVARGIGIMAEIGVLGVAGELVLDDGEAGGVQSAFTDLLGELIERVVHGSWRGAAGGRPALAVRKASRAPLSTSDA